MSAVAEAPTHVHIDLIDTGENSRELDPEHVKALAASIALRGLIVPLLVSANGERFTLIAGHHRYAACRSLDLQDVEITVREQTGTSADSAAENVVRKSLTPLEEARAVKNMLDEGYTLEGAATVLGWSAKLVGARARILELPETAQRLLGSGELPVSSVATLEKIAAASPALCQTVVQAVADGAIDGDMLASNPAWVIGHIVRESPGKVFAAYLNTLSTFDVGELRLPKKAKADLAQAEELHRALDRHAYGPPVIRFSDAEIDRARAAGVLVEFEQATPILTDRDLYRDLAVAAIDRTVEELTARTQARKTERSSHAKTSVERSPEQTLESEHGAAMRELTTRAHGTNLDLGAALITSLATVKPDDMDVARFFAYGLLGSDKPGYSDAHRTAATIAANGIRLVVDSQRDTATPTLKSGKPGRTKFTYAEVQDAERWLWRFVDGARNAGELYGRVLVVFAAQAYAHDLVLPASQRRAHVLPQSRKDTARKAFERLAKRALPASHTQLARALEREARRYATSREELATAQAADADGHRDAASDAEDSAAD
jgi:ParB/RepB/Spo0J family partition protein